jgi:predicted RNA binding protein YcfA (HicA-like mRNA interferase family)
MGALPVISGKRCAKALERLGYTVARQRGSHLRLVHPNRPPVTVPLHDELDRGTLAVILRACQLTSVEFVEALDG